MVPLRAQRRAVRGSVATANSAAVGACAEEYGEALSEIDAGVVLGSGFMAWIRTVASAAGWEWLVANSKGVSESLVWVRGDGVPHDGGAELTRDGGAESIRSDLSQGGKNGSRPYVLVFVVFVVV